MSDPPPTPPPTPPVPPAPPALPTPPPEPPKTFTQEELSRIAAREKQEGRTAGINELLKQLELDDVDQLKEVLKRQKDADDATKSQVQKDAEKAARDKADAEVEKSAAKRDRLMVKVERSLLRAGVADATLDDVAKLVDIKDDADDDAIKEAIDALKKRLPQLFTPVKPEPGTGPPVQGDPGPGPRPPSPTDSKGQAKSLLEQRHAATLARNRK